MHEAERFKLDIVGLTFTQRAGSGSCILEGGWTLLLAGEAHCEGRRAGVALLATFRQKSRCTKQQLVPLFWRPWKGC